MDMELLRESVLDFTDDRLLNIYRNQRGDYNPEAFKIFEDELARRGIDPSVTVAVQERKELATACADAAVKSLNRDDFVPLEYPFSKLDAVTANAILHDSKVPYIIEKYVDPVAVDAVDSAGIFGTSGAAYSKAVFGAAAAEYGYIVDADLFSVCVYKDALEAAQELIDEHFEVCSKSNRYVMRQSDVIDRIKTFSLYDVRISDAAAYEEMEVDLSRQGRAAIVKLAEALLDEADMIEEKQGRVVFFYDSLESIIYKLKDGASTLTRTEFLAIIELCQIYCEDERYDLVLNQVAASILDFFLA